MNSIHTYPFTALGGGNELQLVHDDPVRAQEIADQLIGEVTRIEHKFSRYREDSILSLINRAAGSAPVRVDQETAALLHYADTCFTESSGLFDITSGVLRRAWNFRDKLLPTQKEIAPLLRLIGWQLVRWENPEIFLPTSGMEIDFGGFGKEYAVDRLISMAREEGITSGLINLGGDVGIIGPHPLESLWHVGIIHPRVDHAIISSVSLGNGALATSGDYERFIECDGKRYCHILNPKTGWPVVKSFQSISVVASSCLIAGSATTITMLLGEQRGLRFLKSIGTPYFAVRSDGSVLRAGM